MSDINWQENSVCYANAGQWVLSEDKVMLKCARSDSFVGFEWALNHHNFQLNELREGDFIPASELDTEQKYNEVVEVFGLFGFKRFEDIKFKVFNSAYLAVDSYLDLSGMAKKKDNCKRQLTYHQIIAIGKLKRMILEREKSSPKTTPDNTDQVKSPKHYQLIEGVESIEIIARSMTKEQWKGFCLGNMLKYRIRAGKKDALQQDIEKANFYGELYEMHKEKCYD